MDSDIRITPAQRAYLAAFDHWLKTVWAAERAGQAVDGAAELKDACLARVLGESGVVVPEAAERRRRADDVRARDLGRGAVGGGVEPDDEAA